jgi:dihydroorotate dehydrogenase (NAD+) catalytic subunit
MVTLSVDINGLELKNPVLTASGTFGYGEEYDDFMDVNSLGGIIVKGTTASKREGNPPSRMAETASGMLNAVGLQNKGIDYFIETIYPEIQKYTTPIIVNVAGSDVDEYVEVASKLNKLERVAAIELNISCPNVKMGGMSLGTKPEAAADVTRKVKEVCSKPLIVKLSPNVTDIVAVATAVEEAGANSLSLINTLSGMAIDSETRKPELSTITGGLSGPAIKPVALRMVWQVSQKVNIPVIGLGGIMTASDAIEFILAGATAIQLGTVNFIDPQAPIKIIKGIHEYLEQHQISSVNQLRGMLET